MPDGEVGGELRKPRVRRYGKPQSGQEQQHEEDDARNGRPCFLVRYKGAHAQPDTSERDRSHDQGNDEWAMLCGKGTL